MTPETPVTPACRPPLYKCMDETQVTSSARQLAIDLKAINDPLPTPRHRVVVPFPRAFVYREDAQLTPLMQLISGEDGKPGRGGAVRFRLYLCITFMAVSSPFTVGRTRRINQPYTREWMDRAGITGAEPRRTLWRNLEWLAAHKYIEIERRGPYQPLITLLNSDGSGAPYVRATRPGHHFNLPALAFTRGWLVHLSPVAMAVRMMLENQEYLLGQPAEIVVPGYDRDRYKMSEDAWRLGVRELQRNSLIKVTRVPEEGVAPTQGEAPRVHNSYSLIPDRWSDLPEPPTTDPATAP
jgi:hypothetical protein